MNSNELSLRPEPLRSKKVPKGLIIAFLLVSFLGFLDAGYLTVEHFRGVPPPCTILEGCEKVTTSEYSVIWGVPVALGGAIYYLAVFLLIILYFDRKNEIFLNLASYATIAGLLASAWFTYLQLFVIKAICLYCLFSALTSTTLFIFGMIILSYKRRVTP